MKKIVAVASIVLVQLVGVALFLGWLFNSNSEMRNLAVVENNNLSKMAETVNDLFITEADLPVLNADKNAEEELMTNEEAEKIRAEEQAKKEAEEKAKKEAEEKAKKEAEEKAKKEAEAKAKAEAEAKARAAAAAPSQSVQELQSYAHSLVVGSYGWSEDDYNALVKLWNAESGWNVHCYNSSSGAYGIPQALPGSKMATEGSDYQNNGQTQIRWGLKYIQGRYGSPSGAWQHFLAKNWY